MLESIRHAVARSFRALVDRLQARRLTHRGKVVLITGGSRGLGLCLAREYGRRGAKLVLVARDPDELERARLDVSSFGAEAIGVTCDVTDTPQVVKAFEQAIARFGHVDVVVNNAAEIEVGPFETMTREDFMRALDTNFWGPLDVVLTALPAMRARRDGSIVMISSIGGVIGVPHLIPYCASKFALAGLSYGLRAELAKDGISVTTVCPGLMRTGSPVNALYKGDRTREYAWFSISDSLPFISMSADRAARAIVRASGRGVARLVLGAPAKLALLAQALVPGIVCAVLAGVNRLLPTSRDRSRAWRGFESRMNAKPSSWATLLGARAERRNNQLGDGTPAR